MDKERQVSNPVALVFFNRDTTASELNQVYEGFQGEIVINGTLFLDVTLELTCDLYVMGEFKKKPSSRHNVFIDGSLYCPEEVQCYYIDVNGNICCGGLDCDEICVGENLLCENIDAWSEIAVAGDIEASTLKTRYIYVLGKMLVEDEISAIGIKVGY